MNSFWENQTREKTNDVLIVGAGFAGLWTAFFLKKSNPNLQITIIDKEPKPKGASSRNAGFACFGSPSELLMNFETMGEEKALFWAAERWRGIQHIKQHFGKQIDYENCGGYDLFEDEATYNKCVTILPQLNVFFESIGSEKEIYRIDNEIIKQNDFKKFNYAILNNQEGSLNPAKLINSLEKHLLLKDVNILRGVPFEGYEIDSSCVLVKTSVGSFSSKHLCFATNAFSPKAYGITPGRGQVLITEPIENLTIRGTFHVNNGYTYFRNVGNRVLLGGGRNLAIEAETTDEYKITEQIQQYLETLLKNQLLPNQELKIEQRWAGIMGFTETHEPICEVENQFISIIAGMNGMGVALAPRLGQILAEKIKGVITTNQL